MDKLCNCKSNFLEFTINACKMNPSRLVRENIADLVQNIKRTLNKACNCHSKEEPRPECDHIVGFFAAETSYGAGLFQIEPGEDVSQYGGDVYYCKRCPECGEKLNLKKDE